MRNQRLNESSAPEAQAIHSIGRAWVGAEHAKGMAGRSLAHAEQQVLRAARAELAGTWHAAGRGSQELAAKS